MKAADNMPPLDHCIYPVILSVPPQSRKLNGRARVKMLSLLARQALELCAGKCDLQIGELRKSTHGVPLPFHGHYWSLTHKPAYVGAVISLQRTGIDIEEIRPVSEALYHRVAKDQEWQLGGQRSEMLFFRFWTAKEAVLKAEGLGMAGLSKCAVTQILDRQHIQLCCRDTDYWIEQIYFDDHIASVVKNKLDTQWTIARHHRVLNSTWEKE